MDENQLREMLGIGEDADIEETIKKLRSDAEVTRMSTAEADRTKKFHELFPDEWETQQKLLKRAQNEDARKFADRYANFKLESGKTIALAVPARDKLQETHKKFSEGTITMDDFQAAVDEIAKGSFVELGERGSQVTQEHDGSDIDLVRVFSDRQRALILEGKSSQEALDITAQEMPEGLEAYKNLHPVRGGTR